MFFIYFGENGQHVFYSVDVVYSIGKSKLDMELFLILSKMGRKDISHVFTRVNRKTNLLHNTCKNKSSHVGLAGASEGRAHKISTDAG